MQTNLAPFISDTEDGQAADTILRKCVHCGFCTATCPTYQLLGDELDGPRGRIYLIKQVLEGEQPTASTQLHLDRCLTCRSCETTCPSGVEYGRLLDIGRHVVDSRVQRPSLERFKRFMLRSIVPYRRRFGTLLKAGQLVAPLLPVALKKNVPLKTESGVWPDTECARSMLVLQGCAQSALAPDINAAAARVFSQLGIRLIAADDGCCGALSFHLNAVEESLGFMRRNIDAWWPHIERGTEAIVMTASGCGSMVKDYGHLLRNDPRYAEKAATVSRITRDISEVLSGEDLSRLKPDVQRRVAFQSPCTLQHGQQLSGVVEKILQELGFTLTQVRNAHLCCGSAGSYSLLQPDISTRLKRSKLDALHDDKPEIIATANIGCLTHLKSGSDVPVVHWIQLLA